MIPLTTRRLAERRLLVAKIAATPSPARFRALAFDVLLSEPAKAREMKLAGYQTDFRGEARVVLPLGSKPPEPEKEWIEIADYSGVTHRYDLSIVTPLLGQDCYTLALRARNTKPTRGAAPGF